MTILSMPDEKELMQKVSKGDKRAFTLLFDHYYKSLGSYVYRLTESLEAAEDIVQEVFIKIWMKRATLVSINSFSDYLFILSKHQTLNHLRKQANYTLRFKPLDEGLEKDIRVEESDESFEEFRLLVEQAIGNLPQQQMKIYQLSKFDRLKYEEIAVQLNLSPETVKKHMYLASKAIKAHIKTHLNNPVFLILLTPLIFS